MAGKKKKSSPSKSKISMPALMLILVFAAGIIAIPLVSLFKPKNPHKENKYIEQTEPSFKREGTLALLSSVRDTISQLEIEFAEDEYEITMGLMYRKSMDENRGMLFVFPGEEPRSFWMKNTVISLDIIYISAAQKIVSISKNTTPFSEVSLPSGTAAQYVLEVNAGYCERHNVSKGNFIRFKKSTLIP